MAGTRVNLDLFFADMTPIEVNKAFPALLPAIRAAKAKASKINEGKDNEEITVKATFHICHHDTGDQACEPEQEI